MNKRGAMLLLIFVGLTVLGGGLLMMVRSFSAQNREIQSIDEVTHRAVLKRWVEAGMDCTKTMAANPGACSTAAVAISRKGASATPLIATGGTQVGGFDVRAYCSGSATKTFRIEATATGRNRWFPVFTKTPVTCP